MNTQAEPGVVCIVPTVPPCDFCGATPEEVVDAPTRMGPWACMCESCWERYGRTPGKLGVGFGQIWRAS